MLNNNPQNLQQYSERLWLTRPYPAGNGQDCIIGICFKQDDGSFASVDALRLNPDGIYYHKKLKLGTEDSQAFKFYIDSMTKKFSSGNYTTGLCASIQKLFLGGKTIDEISKELNLPRTHVISLLPNT
ncbi:MAG: hypothetical protein FWG94_03850 [Oscillospiraceae bacterium]|nr:hypothetical protein [Oscillospiraceae bacterium]